MMKNRKKVCVMSLALSLLLAATVLAEEPDIGSAEDHALIENGEPVGLIGGTGIIDGIAEEAEGGYILSQFETVEPAEESYDTIVLTDGVEVRVPDAYNTFLGVDGNYYVCPYREYEIPHVIFGMYSYSGQDFFDLLTYEVLNSCENATISETAQEVQIGEHQMKRIVYTYMMNGSLVRDTRLSMKVGDMFVVFGAKEAPQENATVGSLLEEVAGGLSLANTGTGPLPGNEQPNGREDVIQTSQQQYNFDIVFDQSVANYNGTWIPFDDSYQIYLPSYWVYYAVSDEERAQMVYYHCGNNGGDPLAGYATDMHIVVSKNQLGTQADMNDLVELLANTGYENVFLGRLNGMDAIAYNITEDNLVGFLFQSPKEPGCLITVEGYYIGSYTDSAVDMIQAALCSVCPV